MTSRAAALSLAIALAAAACGGEDKGAAGPGPSQSPAAAPDPHGGAMRATTAAPGKPPVSWTAPAGWKEGRPSSSMRVAQFDVATDADGGPVQCIVFGGAMGSDEDNIARWIGQMGPDAKAGSQVAKSERDGLKITRVAAQGPYTDAMRPGDAKAIPDASLLAAIVESPGGKVYVKLVGPKAQVDAAAKQFDEFIASMK